jgi:hypothetical protein
MDNNKGSRSLVLLFRRNPKLAMIRTDPGWLAAPFRQENLRTGALFMDDNKGSGSPVLLFRRNPKPAMIRSMYAPDLA